MCFQEAGEKLVLHHMYFDDVLLIVEGGKWFKMCCNSIMWMMWVEISMLPHENGRMAV